MVNIMAEPNCLLWTRGSIQQDTPPGADKTMTSNKRHLVVIVGTEPRGPPTFFKMEQVRERNERKTF